MPIYEYRCIKCKKEFELMRPFSQAGETASCPYCGGEGKKQLSVFASKEGFYLKGPARQAFRKPEA